MAMWWNMADSMRSEFEDWHTHEHFPERLGVPGFLRSTRWTDAHGGAGVFVIYELDTHAVLSSAAYLGRLNAPTPWSRKLMPYHQDMVRSQSHVLATYGSLTARHALTVRLMADGARGVERLCAGLREALACLPGQAGLTGAHLFRHEAPEIAQTTEQKIRKAPDQTVDAVVLLTGYDEAALRAAAAGHLNETALIALGAIGAPAVNLYTLSHSALRSDIG
ncbi:hypothetical protein C7R54_25470 [Achromobacter aloeverae]|uniref:Uncharacterized protein n=1 Tax=Achromobacter aloeverae TaxID=1750518 RepID=A0A4Q1HEB8_9BURK|nr:hypothetical protein C7R54_25470 [Achromobacter aloeverae]